MKDKVLYFASVVIAFAFGSLGTYLLMTKQQMDSVMQGRGQPLAAPNNNLNPLLDIPNTPASTPNADGSRQTPNSPELSSSTSIHDYSPAQALAVVNNMPDYMLGQYVDKFMAQGASSMLTDKRQFAERAIEELYSQNDNQPLTGDVKLSLTPIMPTVSMDTASVGKYDKLFAHLDTHGKVPASPFVFIKWVNNQTGQVLLFEKKDIVASSNQNWVSFKPDDGWQQGSYDIRFYQFTSALQPIAQLTYNIYSVDDQQAQPAQNRQNSDLTAATVAARS